jgi:hypothetical protein
VAQPCHELGTTRAMHNTVGDDQVIPPVADHLDRRGGVGEWSDLVASSTRMRAIRARRTGSSSSTRMRNGRESPSEGWERISPP